MTQALTLASGGGLAPAKAMTPEQIELIKRTVARGATNDELAMFLHVAHKSGLDPIRKQIHFMKIDNRVSFVAGVDGLQSRAEGFPDYQGIQAMAVCEKDDFEFDAMKGEPTKHIIRADRGEIVGAWGRCLRKGKTPFVVYVSFKEFNRGIAQWKVMPLVMIEKVARSTVLRRAFPEQFSGIYDPSEIGITIQKDGTLFPLTAPELPPGSPPAPTDSAEPKAPADTPPAPPTPPQTERGKLVQRFSAALAALGKDRMKGVVQNVIGRQISGTGGLKDQELQDVVSVAEDEVKTSQAGLVGPPLDLPASPPAAQPAATPAVAAPADSAEPTQPPRQDLPSFDAEGRAITYQKCPSCGQDTARMQDIDKPFNLDFDSGPTLHADTCQGEAKPAPEVKSKSRAKRVAVQHEEPVVECEYCHQKNVPEGAASMFHTHKMKVACKDCGKKIRDGKIPI